MKRALVIGGTGFIGLAIVDVLLEAGVEVRVTRRKRSITALVRKRPVELVHASLEEPETLTAAMRGVEAVFLAAGHYPRYSLDRDGSIAIGVRGVRNACESALQAGVGRFVYTSSTGTLARAPIARAADERDVPDAMPTDGVYRALKWTMEREVERFAARGLPLVTMLPGGCVGPGDLRLGTGGILVGAVRGLLPWYVEGIVPIVDVEDVARAHLAAATHAAPASRYCIGGHAILVSALLRRIVERFGGKVPDLEIDGTSARARSDHDERRAAVTKARVPVPRELVDIVLAGQPVSNALAERDLGLDLRPLDETLDRAHAWFVRHGFLEPREVRRVS